MSKSSVEEKGTLVIPLLSPCSSRGDIAVRAHALYARLHFCWCFCVVVCQMGRLMRLVPRHIHSGPEEPRGESVALNSQDSVSAA